MDHQPLGRSIRRSSSVDSVASNVASNLAAVEAAIISADAAIAAATAAMAAADAATPADLRPLAQAGVARNGGRPAAIGDAGLRADLRESESGRPRGISRQELPAIDQIPNEVDGQREIIDVSDERGNEEQPRRLMGGNEIIEISDDEEEPRQLTGNNEIIEIYDDEEEEEEVEIRRGRTPIDNDQIIHGRDANQPRLKRRRSRPSSQEVEEDREFKRPRRQSSTPLAPPNRHALPRNHPQRGNTPVPAPISQAGPQSPGNQAAPLHPQGAQAGLPNNQATQVELPYEQIENYDPEFIDRVPDTFNPCWKPKRYFETLTDLDKTELALNHCARTQLKYHERWRPMYHLGIARDGSHTFTLAMNVYHNRASNTCDAAMKLLKTHNNPPGEIVDMPGSDLTSELPRKRKPEEGGGSDHRFKRYTAVRNYMEDPPSAGFAGSEYPPLQTVLQFVTSNYARVDTWKFTLRSADSAGPLIFALRSCYKALTDKDTLLTARLSHKGQEVSTCSMSALEDQQLKETLAGINTRPISPTSSMGDIMNI